MIILERTTHEIVRFWRVCVPGDLQVGSGSSASLAGLCLEFEDITRSSMQNVPAAHLLIASAPTVLHPVSQISFS